MSCLMVLVVCVIVLGVCGIGKGELVVSGIGCGE